MRKIICLALALLLCLSLVVPAFATENGFVPSIAYKPSPELVPVEGEDGESYIGVVRDGDGNIVGYIDEGCLRITPIAHIWDEKIKVDPDVERVLRFAYDGLNQGSLNIDYHKHNAGLNPAYMVVRDLFEARWSCEEHPEMLAPPGVVLELTFDLGIMPNIEVYVQTLDEALGEWSPIVSCVNNGDGTVTCVFEHLCAIAFSVEVDPGEAPEEPASNMWLWILLLIAALAAVLWILLGKKKKDDEEEKSGNK